MTAFSGQGRAVSCECTVAPGVGREYTGAVDYVGLVLGAVSMSCSRAVSSLPMGW